MTLVAAISFESKHAFDATEIMEHIFWMLVYFQIMETKLKTQENGKEEWKPLGRK